MSAEDSKLFIAVYTDEDVTDLLAELLRQQGYDAISTQEVELFHTSDEEQLVFAAAQDRAILTFNRDDFSVLFDAWREQGRDHAGIIISQQIGKDKVGELLRQTLNLLNVISADEMRNTLHILQSFR